MRGAAMSLTAATSGFVLFLLSLSVGQSQNTWAVTYSSAHICALKGSTVVIGCSYTLPFTTNYHTVRKKVWFTKGSGFYDLTTDPVYVGRVTYSYNMNNCTLTITDLRESDSAEYKFRFETNWRGGSYTGLPGVTLTVTAVQVHVDTKLYSSWATTTCQGSCQLRNDLSYTWYKNGHKISSQSKMYLNPELNPSDSYSCAVNGYEDLPSPSVCVQGESCNRVNYSNRRICAVKGSSVEISCTYNSDDHQIISKSWFRSGRTSEDLREDSEYAGRVEFIETERGRSTLIISDLRERDSAEYLFTFRTRSFEWGSSLPGTTLTVTDIQVQVKTRNQLDCVTKCDPHASSYVWYENGEPVNEDRSSISTWSYGYTNSYTCALKGFEDFHSPLVCVNDQRCNRVIYTKQSICAFKGSSVEISCIYSQYDSYYDSKIQSKFWFRADRRNQQKITSQRKNIKEDSQYAGRVEVSETEEGRSTLRISDLRERDSAEYLFTFRTQNVEWKSSLPGTTLTVTALQVKVTRTSVHPSQSETELTCLSSCSPDPHPSFVWFKNDQVTHQQNPYRGQFSPGDVISCALKGHEGYRSDPVYPPKLPSVSLSPSAEIIEGRSVTLTCRSDANPAADYTWYKKDQILLSKNQRLIFRSIQSSDSGEYYCTAENDMGQMSSVPISINVKYSKKTVVVASITVLSLAVIILSVFIFIGRKRCLKQNSSIERPRNNPQQNALPERYAPLPVAQRSPAQVEADVEYTRVTFSRKKEDHDYYNILPTKPKRPKKEPEEDVEYTTVKFSSSSNQELTCQQAPWNSVAVYRTTSSSSTSSTSSTSSASSVGCSR